MSKVAPRIPSGFMELSPADQLVMSKMQRVVSEVFESFGFVPIDTPVMELSEVLLAKAGGETEKQIYSFKKGDTDLALRFDLTVPLARYVVMHQNDIVFPFKRYHIGKVYRGERPQKGRFREFYQCDIDVVGRESLDVSYDAEMPAVIYHVFSALGLSDFQVHINNRKILSGLCENLGFDKNQTSDSLRIVDKIMKIGKDGVIRELDSVGVPNDNIIKLIDFVSQKGPAFEILQKLEKYNIENLLFQTGIKELKDVVNGLKQLSVPDKNYIIDLSITRGLDYYTGTVYETMINGHNDIGSVCSGGRYDNLSSYYTNEKMPGVGISIGLTRLFDQLKDRNLLVPGPKTCAFVLIATLSEKSDYALKLASRLREEKVNVELFMNGAKFAKKMQYANKIGVPFVALIGEDEEQNKTVTVKDMETGQQKNMTFDDTIFYIKNCKSAREKIEQKIIRPFFREDQR